jgi:hypothetical protein
MIKFWTLNGRNVSSKKGILMLMALLFRGEIFLMG